jgi:hypothetical protein
MGTVTLGDAEIRPPLERTNAFTALEAALQWWGADVPEDPGAGELAHLLDEIVHRLREDRRSEGS